MKKAMQFLFLLLALASAVAGGPSYVYGASTITDRLDGVSTSLAIKAPVKAATTANVTLSGLQTIDGVTLAAGDRVLVKSQTTATANGIYDADTGTWTRSKDFDGNRDIAKGTLIPVTDGTTNSVTYWRVTNTNPITVGSTSLTFARAILTDSSTASFVQSGAGAVTRTAQDKMREWYSVTDWGAVGDCTTDDYAAIRAALDGIPNGATLIFPTTANNCYRSSATINLYRTVHLKGGAWHEFGLDVGYGTVIKFDSGVDGIINNRHNTTGATTVANNTYLGADFSTLEDLCVSSAGGAGNGIWMRAVMTLRNFCVRGFGGDGVRILASQGGGGATEGNANHWHMENGRILAIGGDGVRVSGNDVNSGVAINVYVASITGVGFRESSIIGNTFIGVGGQTVTGEFITANSGSGTGTLFDHPYYDGVKTNTIDYPNVVVGGGVTLTAASTGFQLGSAGIAQNAPFRYEGRRATTKFAVQLGVNDTTRSALLFASSDESAGLTVGNTWTYDDTYKVWALQSFSGAVLAYYPNSLATAAIPLPKFAPVFPNGIYLGAVATPTSFVVGTAAPVAGTWRVGDRVFNSAPAVGSPKSWVCTVAGTPGTWVSEGNL